MVSVNVELRNEAVRDCLAAFEDADDAFRQTLDPETYCNLSWTSATA